jgi:DNA replication protein DnaC
LFELIAYRYEKGSMLITSNQAFSEWNSIFGDNMMTVAAITGSFITPVFIKSQERVIERNKL